MFAFFPANSQTWLNSLLISILIAHPCVKNLGKHISEHLSLDFKFSSVAMNSEAPPFRNVLSCQGAQRRCCPLSGSFRWTTWSGKALFPLSFLRLQLNRASSCSLPTGMRGEGLQGSGQNSFSHRRRQWNYCTPFQNWRPFFWLEGSISCHFTSDLGLRPYCAWWMERNTDIVPDLCEHLLQVASLPVACLLLLREVRLLTSPIRTQQAGTTAGSEGRHSPYLASFMDRPSHFEQLVSTVTIRTIIEVALICLIRLL